MAKNLTKDFVDLSNRGFCSNHCSEFYLNHGVSSFNVRPLVIMSEEIIPIEVVVMPHSIPETVKPILFVPNAISSILERNVRSGVQCLYCMKVTATGICLVSRYFVNGEGLSSYIYQLGKLGSISRFSWGYFNSGDNVSLNTAHQMSLNPLSFASDLTPLMVEPSVITGGSEAGGINSKVSFYGFQGAGTLLNESFQKQGEFGILKALLAKEADLVTIALVSASLLLDINRLPDIVV